MVRNGCDNTKLKYMENIFSGVGPRCREVLLGYEELTTLLYHAVSAGAENVVEYLIVECNADIERGTTKAIYNYPPLFAAINNDDISMVKLLVKLGANVNAPTVEDQTIVNEACALGKLSIAKYLIEHGADIYTEAHINRMGTDLDYLASAHRLGCDINRTDTMGRNPLIFAALAKNHEIISYLLDINVRICQRDSQGNNALNVALWNHDHDLIFFLSSWIYTASETIKTFELQGCKMAMCLNVSNAFFMWNDSFIFRQKNSMPRDEVQHKTLGKYTQFKSVEELKKHRFQWEFMMFEALNIYIRLLTPFHDVTIQAAIKISEMYPDDDYISNGFLMDIFRLNWENPDPLNDNLHSIFLRIIASHSNRKSRYFNHQKASREITMYIDYIEEKIWPVLAELKKENINFVFEKYANIVFNIIKFMQFFLEAGPSPELGQALIYRLTQLIKEETRKKLPATLLHQAVKLVLPFGVKLLVQCGADINAPDHRNDIPLHHLGLSMEEDKEKESIASFLIRNGSEVDAVSCDGHGVHEVLQQKRMVKNCLEKVNLKCLAARAIAKNNVVVFRDECPRDVFRLIKIHGGNIIDKTDVRSIEQDSKPSN